LSDAGDMPRARPQFVHLSEAEVWKAIAEDAGGAVEAEVTRLVAELTVRLMARTGDGPEPGGMQVRARCPIERVAVLMLAEAGVTVAPLH
jgi:hypothetical protein